MFQIKDFVSIAASMVNYAKATQDQITDFNVGGVARTMLEAPAIEIEELYQRIFAGIMDAIPVAIYYAFDFDLQDAAYAAGVVVVTFPVPLEEPVVVPEGGVFASSQSGVTYLATAECVAAVGATSLDVPVRASMIGTVGNTAANTIVSAVNFDLPVGSVLENGAISSGKDQEQEDERKARFADYIRTLARGTNGAIEYAARSAKLTNESGEVVEYVSRVGFVEIPSRMDVFVYGSGQRASDALLDEVRRVIDGFWDSELETFVPGYRPVGIRVRVYRMVETPVHISITVEMQDGLSLADSTVSEILTLLDAEIRSVKSRNYLFSENIHNAVLSATGVRKVRTNLAENIFCPGSTTLVPGVIDISEGQA